MSSVRCKRRKFSLPGRRPRRSYQWKHRGSERQHGHGDLSLYPASANAANQPASKRLLEGNCSPAVSERFPDRPKTLSAAPSGPAGHMSHPSTQRYSKRQSYECYHSIPPTLVPFVIAAFIAAVALAGVDLSRRRRIRRSPSPTALRSFRGTKPTASSAALEAISKLQM